ncbi:hypothetical protein PMAYCL1PPCAC_31805 [Pristionchus mayeri]|uniref:Uncharacterized protein n=1 Tax=Pristionchus mayeri TaxID=1317129 RepID=A0AAN5DF83_9BILA|nr:hypothetical protein PMAYCL1PPCAC_31805 [Pristionchus mayeri]
MLYSLAIDLVLIIGCIRACHSSGSTQNDEINALPINATVTSEEDRLSPIVPVPLTKEEECADHCQSCAGDIFLTVLITILVWSPICYALTYKWIKFREEIEANAAYANIRRRTFEMMQQQHGPAQYDSFIGCPVELFNDRHGPPQIDPSKPPPPTTIAEAIKRKISQMNETTKGGAAPY